jgi:hypothetical protein
VSEPLTDAEPDTPTPAESSAEAEPTVESLLAENARLRRELDDARKLCQVLAHHKRMVPIVIPVIRVYAEVDPDDSSEWSETPDGIR